MKNTNYAIVLTLALLLFATLGRAQDNSKPATTQKPASENAEAKPERGMVEFGARQFWGDEYGRPDLPFRLGVQNSKYNEYRDIRDGFFIRRGRVEIEDFLGSKNYVSFQTRSSVYRDQSYLATGGQWGVYKVLFRFDEIPHIFTNTTRTLFTTTAPGVYTISPFLRSSLQGSVALTTLPSIVQTQIVQGEQFITPELERRAGDFLASYNPTAQWTVWTSVYRQHMSGTRPLGSIFNSSPSAAITGGFGVEIPEPINYFTTNFRAGTEYGRESWGVQLNYLGSFFDNQTTSVTFDNPFRTTDCVAPSPNCTAATQGPATGRLSLYPDNTAHYLTVAGAYGLNKRIHLMASINPGWLRQNDAFLPYTSNTILEAFEGPLPSARLNGKKTTLAMNYTLVANLLKHIQFKAGFRDYDYINDTPVRSFTPVQGDFSAPNLAAPEQNTPFAYNRKTFEATGNYYFWKKSSFKAGYVGDVMDRSHRDVSHSLENSFISSLDLVPNKDLSFRVSYRYAVRDPERYFDDAVANITGGLTEIEGDLRRFDEAARTRNRLDAQASWDATDRLTFTAFAGTTQDNYNRRGGVNSPTPLNFLAGTTSPYYVYGVLKDMSNNFGVDADFSLSKEVSFFAEYSREFNHKRMVSRYRVPGAATIPDGTLVPSNCSSSTSPCDSANNDWGSTADDKVDVWSAGTDLYLGKKVYFTTYYSLSAGKGNVNTRPLGDITLATGPNKFLLTGTNAAVPYPETTNRLHEVVAIFKFKLTRNLMPKFEYRFQQWDNRDYQTSAMTPYMGCVSPIPNGPPVTNSVPGCTAPILLTNTAFPVGTPSPFYPFSVVGDTAAARYLFLGADQPSYRVHYVAATLEWHF